MGALPNVFSGYQAVTDERARARMAKAWGVNDLSDHPGLTITEMMTGAINGDIQGLFIMGENPMLSDPDLHHVEKALRNVPFLVVQDIFLTETAQLAEVVLPAACFAEKDGTFTNTERRVQRVRKAVDPPGRARPDWEIICRLANALGFAMYYQSPSDIMDEIASVTPSYAGIGYHRIQKRGLPWPCPETDHPGTPRLHEKQFTRGKGLFHPVAYKEPFDIPDAQYPFYLSTGRILYHWHTGTMTRRTEGLSEKAPECEVEISPQDAKALNIETGNMVNIRSRRGTITAKARITEKAVQGTIFVPFHFAEAAVNKLTHSQVDPVAKIPGFKVCAVMVEKAHA
jgi:predicted molibdopterin-dependent oxidoreductase YjgC